MSHKSAINSAVATKMLHDDLTLLHPTPTNPHGSKDSLCDTTRVFLSLKRPPMHLRSRRSLGKTPEAAPPTWLQLPASLPEKKSHGSPRGPLPGLARAKLLGQPSEGCGGLFPVCVGPSPGPAHARTQQLSCHPAEQAPSRMSARGTASWGQGALCRPTAALWPLSQGPSHV